MPNPPAVNPVTEAQHLLVKLGIKTVPTPVEKIAKTLGAQVRFSPFDDELSGMIFIKDDVPVIGINSLHHPNRQRFTLAHEIGHLVLHREAITTTIHVDKQFPALMRDANSTNGTELREIEANQFASALLIPAEQLEQALQGKQFDIDDERPIDELAKKFRVSRQALEYRIRNRPQKL